MKRVFILILLLTGFSANQCQTGTVDPAQIKFTILYDDVPLNSTFMGDQGFSCLIQIDGKSYLFDAGNSEEVLKNNAEKLGIDASKIEFVFISHMHTDHICGLGGIINSCKSPILYLPADFPKTQTPRAKGFVETTLTGASKVVSKTINLKEPASLGDGFFSTGPIEEKTFEQSLIIKTSKGLIILVGCSHPGIVEIVKRAKAQLNSEVLFVMGGFHLEGSKYPERIDSIASQLKGLTRYLAAGHCNDAKAQEIFKEAFGTCFIDMKAGLSFTMADYQTGNSQTDEKKFPVLKGPWFGQKPPGTTPEVFMPDLFRRYTYVHGKLLFAPDGKEVFWMTTTGDKGRSIYLRFYSKQNSDGTWTVPEESFFSEDYKENGPSYSADGNRIYYQSRAPLSGNGSGKDIDIWYRERKGEEWSEPHNVGSPVNSNADESQPWVAADGSIIFCRDNDDVIAGKSGGSDLYYSKFSNGKYAEPVCLGPEINSEFGETEPAMAPDGSYLVFISNRPGGFSGRMNLYVSFKTPSGGWTPAQCLSHEFKIDNIWFPTFSYDGKYLFFCGGFPVPGGGYSNSPYYWVDTRAIKNMVDNK